jgi:N-acetylmuramoyl-L-alanine amidase
VSIVHIVKQGECLSSIAQKYGFRRWSTIYDHPENCQFKQKRSDPNLIFPGDRIVIPDKTLKQETGAVETRHRFRLLSEESTVIRIIVKNADDEVLADNDYTLIVEGERYEGTTDSQGMIEHEIPADAQNGKLNLVLDEGNCKQSYTWQLDISHLDPLEEKPGVLARLENLGYFVGAGDTDDPSEVVKAFQQANNLTVNGNSGPQTQQKLKDVYGC